MAFVKAMFMEGHVPRGGVCLGAFLLVRREDSILVGKMADPETWVSRFLVAPAYADGYTKSGKLVLPASHLKFGESPADAARRVLREMLQVEEAYYTLIDVQSHLSESHDHPGEQHWDLCFIYDVRMGGEPGKPSWFSELAYTELQSLRAGDFTRGHGDILEELGLVRQ